jgi:hypothetical protein
VVPIPATNGEGAVLDVSGLAACKTFFFSGDFEGEYVVLGSHDDVRYVPILKIEGAAGQQAGQAPGPQTIRREIKLTLKSIKVRRAANRTINSAVIGQETCAC